MTRHCPDIFQTDSQPVGMPSDLAVGLGLAVGVFAAIVIALAVRGDLFRILSKLRLSGPAESVVFAPVIDADLE